MVQFGTIPAKGATVRLPWYSTGGGSRGNVAKGAVSILRGSIPYVARVENRWPASGGVDGETVDEAKVRGPILLRTRNRAVTAEDYEQLAKEAAPEVARVRCVAAGRAEGRGPGGDRSGPGSDGVVAGTDDGVRVLVVPAVEGGDEGRLRFEQLIPAPGALERIAGYLDERRVLGTRVSVEPPTYQGLTVVARVRARPRARVAEVEAEASRALYRYYHPIIGGPEGGGWPFGRPVHVGEVYAVLQRVDGIDYVEDARLFAADPLTGERGESVTQIVLPSNSLVFSYEHVLRVDQ
jgi:predicted phage baseplate assembly protein